MGLPDFCCICDNMIPNPQDVVKTEVGLAHRHCALVWDYDYESRPTTPDREADDG